MDRIEVLVKNGVEKNIPNNLVPLYMNLGWKKKTEVKIQKDKVEKE